MYQGQVKAALIKGTTASLNDFTEVMLRCATAKESREEKQIECREISVRKVKFGVHFQFNFLLQVSSS